MGHGAESMGQSELNAECGLRPVGAIGAYAPEGSEGSGKLEGGMRNAEVREVGMWNWEVGMRKAERGNWKSECGMRKWELEVGRRPPARRGHRGLRPGGNAELMKIEVVTMVDERVDLRS